MKSSKKKKKKKARGGWDGPHQSTSDKRPTGWAHSSWTAGPGPISPATALLNNRPWVAGTCCHHLSGTRAGHQVQRMWAALPERSRAPNRPIRSSLPIGLEDAVTIPISQGRKLRHRWPCKPPEVTQPVRGKPEFESRLAGSRAHVLWPLSGVDKHSLPSLGSLGLPRPPHPQNTITFLEEQRK